MATDKVTEILVEFTENLNRHKEHASPFETGREIFNIAESKLENYVKEEREKVIEEMQGVPLLEEWITIFKVLKIIIQEGRDFSGNLDDDYTIEKFTDDIHGAYRKYLTKKESE